MSISKKIFGQTQDNIDVELFTLKNSNGTSCDITTYGATVVSFFVKDKTGNFIDVVLGYDSVDGYIKGNKFLGTAVGRCANRIENSTFKINDIVYNVVKNEGKNHLHGGTKGFDKVVWTPSIPDDKDNTLELSYISKDGEEGYPGTLNVKVIYTLTEDDSLKIEYFAISDKDTIVNLTNHSYFNLSGHNSGSAINHKLYLNASTFTVNDKFSIPTGEIRNVENTPLDFSNPKVISKDINSDYEQILFGAGFDHNWMLNTNGDLNEICATLTDENSGIVMDVYTTKPAIQFYSGNFLDGLDTGKDGAHYEKRSGVCLETQYVPNAINMENFTSPLLRTGEEYKHTTIYKFSTL